ncbi:MAG: M6 family metalloprotease domain-containing protein [Armatimonadetes bacterium]|nr:M6 family metalloprotease domain-containing protein [Armatimonadota bacterium]
MGNLTSIGWRPFIRCAALLCLALSGFSALASAHTGGKQGPPSRRESAGPRAMPPHPSLPPEVQRRMLEQRARFGGTMGAARRPVRNRGRAAGLYSPAAGARAPLVSGTKRMPCALIQFPDQLSTYSVANFQNLLFVQGGVPTGSARDFYLESSYGQLTVTGTAVGWYQTANARSYYGDGRGGVYSTWCAYEAAQRADAAGVNWAQFDNDGDGYVDTLWVVHSGRGADESGDGNDIWSHSWSFGYAKLADPGFPGVFTTSTDDPNRPGQKIKIDQYIIQPEASYYAGGAGAVRTIVGIGVFCHEFGHALGLPDLYDTGGAGGGLGYASLMASGSWGGSGGDSRFPSHMDAWSKASLGWLNPTAVTTNMAGTLSQVETNQSCYLVKPAGSALNQYYLVENRQRVGFDRDLYATGLFVYHIDEAIIQAYSSSNQVNVNTHPYGVALEEADATSDSYASMDLFAGRNRGNATDSWPNGSRQGFSPYSVPSVKNNAGTVQDCAITPIPSKAAAMVVNLFVQGTQNADAYEADDAAAAAKPITPDAPAQAHSLVPLGDVDWVRFSATVGGRYGIETTAPSAQPPLNTLIQVYDAGGSTLLGSNDDGPTPPLSRLEWVCPATGDYTVRVSTPNASEIGFYNIAVTRLGDRVSGNGASLAPSSVIQGQAGVAMLRLNITVEANDAVVTALRVDETGSSTQASDVARISIYRDANGNGAFDAGTDTLAGYAVPVSQSTWVPLTPQTVPAAGGATFFVVYDLGMRAKVGMTLAASLVDANAMVVQAPDMVQSVGFPISSAAAVINAAPPGPPSKILLGSVPSKLVADGVSTATVTAQVEDDYGNAVLDGVVVAFTTDKGGITASAPTAAGKATATLTAGSDLGTATVRATAGSASAMLSVPFVPGPPAAVSVAAANSSLTADGTSTTQITATVVDVAGRNVSDGTAVTFSADAGSVGAGTVTVGGKATVTYTAGTTVGSAKVTATAGGVSGDVVLTLTPGASANVAVSATVTQLPADGASTSTLTAVVTDARGNKVADGTVVGFAVDRGAVSPAAAPTSGGQASVTFTAGRVSGPVNITATAGSATGTLKIWLIPGPPASISVVPAQTSATADGASTVSITATVLDASGGPVADGTVVSLSVNNGGITPSAATADGKVTVTYTAGTTVGTVTVTATAGAASGTATLSLLPGAPGSLTLTAAQATLVADGASATVVTATVKDANGNLVADGTTVTFATDSGSITPGASTTAGQATATYTSSKTAGTARVTAAADGQTKMVNIALVAGAPAKIEVAASRSELVADGAASTVVTATVKDANGNAAAGATVTFQADSGSIPASATADASGAVSVTLTAPTRTGTGTITAASGGAQAMLQVVYVPGAAANVALATSAGEVLANGAGTLQVTATVTDANGNNVADGTTVIFSAGTGSVVSPGATTGGKVTVLYTAPSATRNGTATLTAWCGNATGTADVALVAPAVLTGRVSAPDGVPPGAALDVMRNGQVVGTLTTTADGSFQWTGAPGTYDVLTRAAGYVTVLRRGVDLQTASADGVPRLDLAVQTIRQPEFATGLHLVTFPFAFADPAIESVTGDAQGLLAHWLTDARRYALRGEGGFPTVAPGTAYWLQRSANPVHITQAAEPVDQGAPVRLRLKPGWNLAGNPYLHAISASSLAVSIDGGAPVRLNAPEAAAAVRDYLWAHDSFSGQYSLVMAGSSRKLNVWQACWIRALRECELVVLPYGRGEDAESADRAPRAAARMTAGRWEARLVAVAGDARDEHNTFGVGEAARRIEAPPLLRDYVDVRFLQPTRAELDAGTSGLASDIREAGEASPVWRFQVLSDLPSRSVTLQWPDVGRVPARARLVLVDEATGARRRLRSSAGYTFTAEAGVPRQFRIEMERGDALLQITDVSIRPAGRGGKAIGYTLSAPAAVTVEVLSPSGKRLRLVASQQAQPQGRSEVVFDGGDGRGVPLAAGVYLVQVTAAAEEGTTARAVRPLVLTR